MADGPFIGLTEKQVEFFRELTEGERVSASFLHRGGAGLLLQVVRHDDDGINRRFYMLTPSNTYYEADSEGEAL